MLAGRRRSSNSRLSTRQRCEQLEASLLESDVKIRGLNAVKQDLEFKCKELKDGNKGIEERGVNSLQQLSKLRNLI